MSDDKNKSSTDAKDKGKKSNARITFTKCSRCGKRVKTKDVSSPKQLCPECQQKDDSNGYWEINNKLLKKMGKNVHFHQ